MKYILLILLLMPGCVNLLIDEAGASHYDPHDEQLQSAISYRGKFPVDLDIDDDSVTKLCDLEDGTLIYIVSSSTGVDMEVIKDGCEVFEQ